MAPPRRGTRSGGGAGGPLRSVEPGDELSLALVALVFISPLMFFLALAVKLTSRGPVFYTQTRVGLDRRWSRTAPEQHKRAHDLGGRVS